MVRRTCGVVACVALLACYRPSLEIACETECSIADQRCPAEMACGADLRCHGNGQPDCSDAAVPITIDAQACFGTALAMFDPVCDPVGIPATLTLPAHVDTDAGCAHVQVDGSQACVVIATDITIDQPVAVSGSLPLAVIATHDLTVTAAGSIDAGSHTATGTKGAGTAPASCEVEPGADDLGGGGGGAGGAFQGAGGAGGGGDFFGGSLTPGGIATAQILAPMTLRAGCRGSTGGGSPGGTVSNAGDAGGGLYLVAGDRIDVAGWIGAGGAGGHAGVALQGGGGGGSGGMIVFEAPSVTISSIVFADGGGGSGGGGATAPSRGNDADRTTTGTGAAGGSGTPSSSGSSAGGTGGRGSFLGSVAGRMGGNEAGAAGGSAGAGGGGGAGFILIVATTKTLTGATISPPAP